MWPFSKKNKKPAQPTNVYLGTPRSGSTNSPSRTVANPRRTQLNDSDISTTQSQQGSFYAWGTQQVYGDDSSSRHHSHHSDSSSSSTSYDSGSHHHSSGSDSSSYSSGSDSSSYGGSDSSSW